MTYFHPWTLLAEYGDNFVPAVNSLRGDFTSWDAAMRVWLDGHILCEESRRYINNFLAMHRVRPSNAEEDDEAANSDDMLNDEDVQVTRGCLEEVLNTRAGSVQNTQTLLTTMVIL